MKNYEQEFAELCSTIALQGASDLHLSVARHPTIRIDDALIPLSDKPILTSEDTAQFASILLSEERRARLEKERDIDLSYAFKDKARFRVNIFYQRGNISIAMRMIPARIQTVGELNLPPILSDFTKRMQGFFLVVGPSGHGKSTTLAALIDEVNHSRADHIVTIEDPIEYLFTQDRAIIDQREIGFDSPSFSSALRAVFRQDPDVIMVGEMRDPETMAAAITAAETGHLVFATLHTNNAAQTIDRIIDSFPAAQQNQIRSQLALSLMALVSQRLVSRIEGGRVPACEVMIANPAVRNLVRERKTHELDLVIETSADEGMISLNRSLADLVRKGQISLENAELYSLNPKELHMLLSSK